MKKKQAISIPIMLAVVCLTSCHLRTYAQMTLNDCLIYAREHSRANNIRRIQEQQAKAETGMTASSLLPTLGFSSGGSLSFGRNIDPETNTYDNRKTLSTSFGLSISLPLFDGLVNINNLKAAKVAALRAEQSGKITADQTSLEVIRAFLNISYCQAMVSQMQLQLQSDSATLAATRREFEYGTKSGADVAEIEALVANDRFELTNQEGLLRKARLQLKGVMGMEIETDTISLNLDYDTEAFFSGLHEKNPRLEEAQLLVSESQIRLNSAKGAYSPRLSFNAGVSTSYYKVMGLGLEATSFHRQWRDNMGQYLGLSFYMPLFDGLYTPKKVKRAALAVAESRLKLEQTQYEINKETAEAELDLKTVIAELESASQRLTAEQVAHQAVKRKYELGGASAIDLFAAGSRLANARAAFEGKRVQRIINSLLLDYYNGIPFIRVKN